jgi:hypothetical protein
MKREDFVKVAEETLDSLPEEFRIRIQNVAILVEDFPANQRPPKLGQRRRRVDQRMTEVECHRLDDHVAISFASPATRSKHAEKWLSAGGTMAGTAILLLLPRKLRELRIMSAERVIIQKRRKKSRDEHRFPDRKDHFWRLLVDGKFGDLDSGLCWKARSFMQDSVVAGKEQLKDLLCSLMRFANCTTTTTGPTSACSPQ